MKSPFDLPDLAVVFDELRKGRHICVEDGDLYRSLLLEYESFCELFRYLGFTLVRHPRDFFYFETDLVFTSVARRMAVFMFILIEHLANEGISVEEALTSGYISIATLPHGTSKRFRRYMDEAGITVEKSINTLARHGFVEYSGGSKFRFRSPVYRFIDLCLTVIREGEPGDEVDDTELLAPLDHEESMDD